ncbi:hypothetical protein ATK78_3067 [Pedobacter metabolipauper]|uniref:Uncharacterized protein n=1 Tax=Pedobacter metabolipauper TaxID=425513 RepID=A0A4R6SW03_9SPHI|nr:hypothetical protein ATK78_3067 [Pedobacter metabolipauper]
MLFIVKNFQKPFSARIERIEHVEEREELSRENV